MTVLQV